MNSACPCEHRAQSPRRRQENIHQTEQISRGAGKQAVEFHRELGWQRQNHFGLAAKACVYDSASGAPRTHGNHRQRVTNTEPCVFGFVIAFETRRFSDCRCASARTYCGHIDVVFQKFRTKAFRKPSQGEFPTLYGTRCGTLILPPIEEILTMRPWRRR